MDPVVRVNGFTVGNVPVSRRVSDCLHRRAPNDS